MTGVTTREREIVYRFALARRFTSPATSIKPRIQPEELRTLQDKGLIVFTDRFTTTDAGEALVADMVAAALPARRTR